jgi:hypothetical protein
MSAVRGFTTLQLLELATISDANRRRATNQVPVSQSNNQKAEDLARSRTVVADLEVFLSQGGRQIQLPIKRGLRVIRKLSGGRDSNAWFNDGRAQPTFRARTPEGEYIESQRGRLYDLVAGNLQYLANQANFGTSNAFGQQGRQSTASALDDVVTTSWKEASGAGSRSGSRGGSPRGAAGGLLGGGQQGARSSQQAFQERLRKIEAVWALTQRNQEPPEIERQGGGGRIGQRQPASEEDVHARVAQSNGFLSKNLAEVMAGNIQNRRRTQGVSAQVLQQNQALQQAIRAAFGLPAGQLDAAQLGQARQGLSNLSAQQLNQRFLQLAGGNPEALREALWASLGDVSLRRLLGGLGIRKPESAGGRRDFRHSAGQARGAAGDFDAAFSRFVYDELFDAYLQRGAQGDKMPEDAQRRSQNRGNRGGPRGVLGTNDRALQGLSLANANQVASFVFKALQRSYTLEALKAGARALGVPVEESAVLQDAVIQQIANHVVVSYSAQLQAGSPAHTSAVAAAVRLRGFSELRTPQAVAEARQAIIRTLDAQNGLMTEPCQMDDRGRVVNYSRRDLKRIAKANGISLRSTNMEAACAELSGQVQQAAASADALSSGRRQERVIGVQGGQKSGGRSGRRSGNRTQAATGGLGGLAAQGPLSAGTQAAFANFLPQAGAAPVGLGGGSPRSNSGRRLSGGIGAAAAPTSPRRNSGGLGGGQAGANNLMSLFGNQ